MKIVATTNFKHGRLEFEKDTRYDGPERVFGYFCMCGWAKELEDADQGPFTIVTIADLATDAPKLPQDGVTLDVQSAGSETFVPRI